MTKDFFNGIQWVLVLELLYSVLRILRTRYVNCLFSALTLIHFAYIQSHLRWSELKCSENIADCIIADLFT
jgi:hypothetical protein